MDSNQQELKVDNEELNYDPQSDAQSTFEGMDPEQRQKLEEELKAELAKTEEEIQTLRQVLAARIKHSHELKRKLGIGVWKELQNDLQQGIKNVQETTASGLGIFNTPYQKTSETVKFAAEKTTDIFGSLGDTIGRRLVDVKNSSAFKSFEERVGSAVSNVKTGATNVTSRVISSRSSSTNNFGDVLGGHDQKGSDTLSSPSDGSNNKKSTENNPTQ